MALTTVDGGMLSATNAQYTMFKNRIINGNMIISQYNGSSSTTPIGDGYFIDRWRDICSQGSKFTRGQNLNSVTPPSGFINYLGVQIAATATVGAADYFILGQRVEGFNIADLNWGATAAAAGYTASPVTLSFWVRSNNTGTFGGSIQNSAASRSYPFTYTISAANTWEQKSITIPGDTAGTWLTTNGIGIALYFGLGVGTTYSGTANTWAGATYYSATGATSLMGSTSNVFYVTGVQLEKGSAATAFDYRPYTTELQLCQRYYYKQQAVTTASIFGSGFNNAATNAVLFIPFPVAMRTSPTALEQTGTASNYSVYYQGGSALACSAVPIFNTGDVWSATVLFTVASGLTSGQASMARANSTSAYLAWSAEL